DPAGAISVHGVCGIWGVLSVGIFADGTANYGGTQATGALFGDWGQLGAQLIGSAVLIAWAFGVSFVFFKLLMAVGLFRSKPEESSNLLLTVALVLVAAKLGATASQRFGLPAVFGKLVVGLALGPAVLNLLEPSQSLESLADIGIILLMFIAGLETDMAQMRSVGKAAFLAATGGVALPMA